MKIKPDAQISNCFTPDEKGNSSCCDVLDQEEARLRSVAHEDAFAMSALGKFLIYKRANIKEGNKWQRRAVETLAKRLLLP